MLPGHDGSFHPTIVFTHLQGETLYKLGMMIAMSSQSRLQVPPKTHAQYTTNVYELLGVVVRVAKKHFSFSVTCFFISFRTREIE